MAAGDDEIGVATVPFRQQDRSGLAPDQDADTDMGSVHADGNRGHPEQAEIGGNRLDGGDRSYLGEGRARLLGQGSRPTPRRSGIQGSRPLRQGCSAWLISFLAWCAPIQLEDCVCGRACPGCAPPPHSWDRRGWLMISGTRGASGGRRLRWSLPGIGPPAVEPDLGIDRRDHAPSQFRVEVDQVLELDPTDAVVVGTVQHLGGRAEFRSCQARQASRSGSLVHIVMRPTQTR